jgi:hypothetical protein
MKMTNNMDMKTRIKYGIVIIMALSSFIYSAQYIGDSYKRAWKLSALSLSGRQLFIEYEYKYLNLPYYEYVMWLKNILPARQTLGLLDKKSYFYYYSKLNYYLYPRYISANVPLLEKIEGGKESGFEKMDYGTIVFAVSIAPKEIYKSGYLQYILLNGERYYLIARYAGNTYLAATKGYIESTINKNRTDWYRLYLEFSLLYPGHTIQEMSK